MVAIADTSNHPYMAKIAIIFNHALSLPLLSIPLPLSIYHLYSITLPLCSHFEGNTGRGPSARLYLRVTAPTKPASGLGAFA
ncbi:hypothetical protein [Komagataeibacter europaeus]|uniref:hypothetical protein n=1 Tax=Komagataeibacter europaeus TaxID=33995 RepID=UPI00222FB48E|nr:hypothetical protein [Komagataeibacter europaeus]